MLHWLKRHPIPISAFFRHSLVLTYAFPPKVLEPYWCPDWCSIHGMIMPSWPSRWCRRRTCGPAFFRAQWAAIFF